MKHLKFSGDPVKSGVAALRSGAPIVTDSNMMKAGISRFRLQKVNPLYEEENIFCRISDEEVIARAKTMQLPLIGCRKDWDTALPIPVAWRAYMRRYVNIRSSAGPEPVNPARFSFSAITVLHQVVRPPWAPFTWPNACIRIDLPMWSRKRFTRPIWNNGLMSIIEASGFTHKILPLCFLVLWLVRMVRGIIIQPFVNWPRT